MKQKPALTKQHKCQRLTFTNERVHWKNKWKRILVTEEKNLIWVSLMDFNSITVT